MIKPLFIIITVLMLFTGLSNCLAQQPADTASQASAAHDDMPAGMDSRKMAQGAVNNHYPLPGDVLRYQKQMDLSPLQISRLTAANKTLSLKKREVSQSVTLNEKTLDKIFKSHRLNEGAIVFYGNRYGLYEGEMRSAILTACFQAAQVLTARQIARFEQLQKP